MILKTLPNLIIRLKLLVLLSICQATYYHADEIEIEWFSDFDVNFQHNDNIGKAEFERDRIEENSLQLHYALIANLDISNLSALTFSGGLSVEQFDAIQDLSRQSLSFKTAFRWQHSLGFLEPFYQINHQVQLDEYEDDQRDSTISTSQLFMTKRFDEQWTMVVGLEHFLRDSDGSAFDLFHNRLFINFDFTTLSDTTYYFAASYRQGEIVSSAQRQFCNGLPADDIFHLIRYAKAIETDFAFSRDLCGDWVAYKLAAETQTATVGMNMPLTESTALDISVTAIDSKADGDIEYDSMLYAISYLVRF